LLLQLSDGAEFVLVIPFIVSFSLLPLPKLLVADKERDATVAVLVVATVVVARLRVLNGDGDGVDERRIGVDGSLSRATPPDADDDAIKLDDNDDDDAPEVDGMVGIDGLVDDDDATGGIMDTVVVGGGWGRDDCDNTCTSSSSSSSGVNTSITDGGCKVDNDP
jgi:hypothetical protein